MVAEASKLGKLVLIGRIKIVDSPGFERFGKI